MSNIIAKLAGIQTELKAPKNQFNKFGGYKYRNCEDILEAVKPILSKLKVALVLHDELEERNGRTYIKAVATIHDCEGEGTIFASAYAREEIDKKGMDSSQMTGAASSYARKYALNGLFGIDDTKDADSLPPKANDSKEEKAKEEKPKEYKCCDCGKPFEPFTSRAGKEYTAGQVYHMAETSNTDGKARCKDCAVKAGTRKEKANG